MDGTRRFDKNLPRVLSSPRLPELPPEVDRLLLDRMYRGAEAQRAAIEAEVERTLVEEEESRSRRPRGSPAEPSLEVGGTILVPRRVRDGAGSRQVMERFEVKEQLSSPSNISGDVFRATRYWGDQLYGDVVLKTPKAELREESSEPASFDYRAEMLRELRNLRRFEGHPGILAPSGQPFLWCSELVIQMKFQPWAFHEYLKYYRDDVWLSAALASLACQCLAAIDLMAKTRDEEGPEGYAHVDLKSTHLRLDYHDSRAPDRDGDWVVSIIDLDSVLPVGPIDYHGAKYNRGCVDPEKFMNLDDPSRTVTVDPAETVYALGLTFLSAVALVLGTGVERRGFRPIGLGQRESGAVLEDAWALREEIDRTRAVDRANFLRVYYLNRARRLQAGMGGEDPPELSELVQGEPTLGPLFGGERDGCTVDPRFFVGIHECLRRRSERLTPGELQILFKELAPLR